MKILIKSQLDEYTLEIYKINKVREITTLPPFTLKFSFSYLLKVEGRPLPPFQKMLLEGSNITKKNNRKIKSLTHDHIYRFAKLILILK